MNAIIESRPCIVAKPRTCQSKTKITIQKLQIWQAYNDKMFHTYFITEDLVQRPISLHQTVHSCQPQSQEAVVDALHQYYLTHNEHWVPDVATEVTCHCGLNQLYRPRRCS